MGLALALLFGAGQAATADTIVNFSWTGTNGYSALDSFSYNPLTTLTSFSEVPGAVGPTKYVESFGIAFYDPSHALLESGSSIVNSVTSDRFFDDVIWCF